MTRKRTAQPILKKKIGGEPSDTQPLIFVSRILSHTVVFHLLPHSMYL